MPYEIQHCTCDGDYISAFYYPDADSVLIPETFTSRSEAQAALDEFLSDLDQERRAGQIERFDRGSYRIGYIYGSTINEEENQHE